MDAFLRFLKSWSFPILFIFVVAISTERSLKKVRDEKEDLINKLEGLRQERAIAVASQTKLQEQVNSQSDPATVELALKRVLGLVPEGQIKVLFQPVVRNNSGASEL